MSLDSDVEAQRASIEEAGMDTEPAKLIETGPVAEAREAQGVPNFQPRVVSPVYHQQDGPLAGIAA
ncbi:MAG: hypothetical protein MJE77_06315 [Proteobacteria bacterium]|nr:hypothetical protein [Pseudomonadota bacterium]